MKWCTLGIDKMYETLKKRVYDANMLLPVYGLVTFTWGNVSEIDRELGVFAIKPSGVRYEDLSIEDIVVLNLCGEVVEGKYRPSSDTATHLHLYNAYDSIGGIVHTHSRHATIFAQAKRSIVAYGTTHADYFYGDVLCTRPLTNREIDSEYELNTGKVIEETYALNQTDPMKIPGILVGSHGPFAFGINGEQAVFNAVVLEEIAYMSLQSELLFPGLPRIDQGLLDKHYMRKHGPKAYYGQK